jgi:hypothetical protein
MQASYTNDSQDTDHAESESACKNITSDIKFVILLAFIQSPHSRDGHSYRGELKSHVTETKMAKTKSDPERFIFKKYS